MSFLDNQSVPVECPECGFITDVTIREVRLQDAIICRGCKGTLQLLDHMHSVRKAQRTMERALDELGGNRAIAIQLRL